MASMRWSLGLSILIAGASACSNSAPNHEPKKPAEEYKAEVSFVKGDGSPFKLSSLKGKIVVLLFMRGFTGEFACFHCGKQTRSYKGAWARFNELNVEIIMVLPGAKETKGYLQKVGENDEEHPDSNFSVPFLVVTDPDFSACKKFKVEYDDSGSEPFPVSDPATIVLGKDGKIIYEYHGKDPSDRPQVEEIVSVLGGKPIKETPKVPEEKKSAVSIQWVSYDDGMKNAKDSGTPVMLEFFAEW